MVEKMVNLMVVLKVVPMVEMMVVSMDSQWVGYLVVKMERWKVASMDD